MRRATLYLLSWVIPLFPWVKYTPYLPFAYVCVLSLSLWQIFYVLAHADIYLIITHFPMKSQTPAKHKQTNKQINK